MSADDVFAIESVIDLLDDIDASDRDEVVERLCEAEERLREVAAMIEVGDAEAQKVVSLGVAPATVEGSESRDAVVGASADGDHAVAGTAPGEITPYELTGEQCVELAALLRDLARCRLHEFSDHDGAAEAERWADMLTDAQPCGCGDVGCPECDNISAAERSHTEVVE